MDGRLHREFGEQLALIDFDAAAEFMAAHGWRYARRDRPEVREMYNPSADDLRRQVVELWESLCEDEPTGEWAAGSGAFTVGIDSNGDPYIEFDAGSVFRTDWRPN